MIFAMSALAIRACDLQIGRGEETAREFQVRRSHTIVVPSVRGRILDRHGREVARDERSFDLYVELEDFQAAPLALPMAASLIGAPIEEVSRVVEKHAAEALKAAEAAEPRWRDRALRNERRHPRLLWRNIPPEAAFEIELRESHYPGLEVRETLRRIYPYGPVAAHVLGYVGLVRREEYDRMFEAPDLRDAVGETGVERLKRRGELMRELVGRLGVERSLDEALRGRFGLATIERNVETGARWMVELAPPRPGEDVRLSLDIELQKEVERILEESPHPRQSAIVVDARSGGILAMVSKPGFDPNAFVPPGRPDRIRGWTSDAAQPLFHRAAAGAYPLGSIFKAVTAYAALECGAVDPHATIECRGRALERGEGFRCWLYREHGLTHGPLDLAGALEQSCNCYFFELGRRLKREQIEAAARRFGFGGRPGSFPAQTRWTAPDNMSLAIGQSSLLATPLQVAQMMAVIANAGKNVVVDLTPTGAEGQAAEAAHVRALGEGLLRVVSGARGTAKDSGLARFMAAGKTSSAQTSAGQEAHAWFAGFAPADRPEVVVVTLVEHGTSGGHAAAPLAAKILERVFRASR
jgi:penicillin-binding protein 2